jgi:hypothetical protein
MQGDSNYKVELEKNGAIAFVPGGNSMWPTLKNRGQSVIVKKKSERLKKFDVALYQRNNGAFVLHRVIEPVKDGYIICGDSQFTLENVKEEQVFGVMEGFYRGKKYIACTDKKYCKEVSRWYKRKNWRKFRLKCFFFGQRVKNKLRRIFVKKRGEEDV